MEGEGEVIAVHTVDAWTDLLQKANDSKKLMVVDFAASWCGPCRVMAPFLADLAKKQPNVIFVKSVATDWAVESMPTFVFVKEGKILGKVTGSRKEELQAALEKHMAA